MRLDLLMPLAMSAALFSIVTRIPDSSIVYLIDEAIRIISIDGAMVIIPFTKVLPSSRMLIPESSTATIPAIRNMRATIIIV